MNVFATMLERVLAAADALAAEGALPANFVRTGVTVEPPRDSAFGDMTTNAALVLASEAGQAPRDLADAIAARLRSDPLVERAEPAGPGFINLTLRPAVWTQVLRAALIDRGAYGHGGSEAGRIIIATAKEACESNGFWKSVHLRDETDRNAVRFMMLFRAPGSAPDIDLAKAREQSYDNPAFRVKYGHARAGALFRRAHDAFPDLPPDPAQRAALLQDASLELLTEDSERALLRLIAQYPHFVETAAKIGEPHRLAVYLDALANAFHAHSCPGKATPHLRFIIQNDRRLTVARLALVEAVVIILGTGLALLGVEAPDEIT